MIIRRIFSLTTLLCILTSACGQKGFEAASSNGQRILQEPPASQDSLDITGLEPNVIPVIVGCGYINEPCVSVTVCVSGTTTCRTINNVLLDTGSFGLRLFSSVLSGLALTPSTDTASGNPIAECVRYGDGSSTWGPIKRADVKLAQRQANNIPIQIIDANFATGHIPTNCTNNLTGPSTALFNGILGVGLFAEDCGIGCTRTINLSNSSFPYFSCSSTTCSPVVVSIANQVTNPVPMFSSDNNGVIVQLNDISTTQAPFVDGFLVFGIGTQDFNQPTTGQKTFAADTSANIRTTFKGQEFEAFIDSGSNGIFFPTTTGIPACSNGNGFYCPTSTTDLSATISGKSGTPTELVNFQIINPNTLLETTGVADIGGNYDSGFDWGLPFFLGRTIYFGIESKASNLGVGPYYAY
jgi:hypothetical protein